MKRRPFPAAMRITLLYAFVGAICVLFFFSILPALVHNPRILQLIDIYGIWASLIIPGLFVFLATLQESRRAVQTGKKSEDVFQNALEGFFQSTPEGKFLSVNPAMAAMFGYSSPEEMIASVQDIADEIYASPEERQNILERISSEGQVQKTPFRTRRKDGTIFWVSGNARAVRGEGGEILYLEGFLNDISEEQKARDGLHAAEARYRALVENVPAVVYILTFGETRIPYISPQIEELTGYPPEQWTKEPSLWAESIHPEDRQRVEERVTQMRQTGEGGTMEYRLVRRDGRAIWVLDRATPVQDQNGVLQYYQGVLIEISRQKEAEAARAQSEERFSKAFHTSPVPTCITTWEEGRLLDANPAFWELAGYPSKEILGNSILEADFNSIEKHQAFLEQLERQTSIHDMEDVFYTSSGEALDVLVSHEIIQLNDQKCILSMFHDITSQKKTHDDVIRKEAILSAITFAADQFLKSTGWTASMDAILERFGQAANVSRVYIFKVISDRDSHAVVSQIFEWSAPGIVPMADDPVLNVFDMTTSGLQRWTELFEQGEPVFGITRQLPESEQAEFVREGILSLICVPITVGGSLWGFIGLDDCLQERVWSHNEIDSLRTAANILSGAIQREQVTQAANRQLRELTMLHNIAVATSSAVDTDTLVKAVTDIIHTSMRPDNCGVLLINESDNTLLPHPSYRGGVAEELKNCRDASVGVAGMVLARGETMRIGDVRTIPEYREIQLGILSELCVPLISNDRVIGVINIESRLPDAFDEVDERLMKTVAGGLATSLQKIQLFEVEGRRAREAEKLRQATTTLTSSLDLNTLLNTILDRLMGFAPYDSASIGLIENGTIKIAAGRNLPPGVIGRKTQLERLNFQQDDHREPILRAATPEEATLATFDDAEGVRSWMGIPLYAHDDLIGFISLNSRQERFYNEGQASLAQTFANQAASAVQNAHLYESEQQRRKEAETLREALAVVASDLDQEQSIQRILDQLEKVVPFRSASVQLLTDGYLEIVGGRGWDEPAEVLGMRFPVPGNNPNSEVVRSRRSQVLGNAPDVYTNFQRGPHQHIQSWLGVPLIARDNVLGMLAIDHSEPDFYTHEHVRLVEIFASQAAIAIANVRTFQEEKRRTQIIEALADIANEFATTQEMGHLLNTVSQRSLELLKASHVAIYLVQSDNKTVKVVSARGTYSRELISHTIRVGEGITGNIIAMGKAEVINDTRNDPRTITVPGTPVEDGNVETMMSAPLILRGQSIGAINAWRLRSDGFFNESELNFLKSIAHQTSISIGMSRLFEETVKRAQEAAAVAQVGRDVSSTLQLDLVLERIAEYAKDLLRAETSAVYMMDDRDGKLHGIAVRGSDAEEIKNDPLTLGAGIAGQIALSKIGEIVNYATSDPRAIIIQGTDSNPEEHIMGVPVLTKDLLTGLVVVWRTGVDKEFQPSELSFLSSLAQQAAVAIQNARSFTSEQKQRQREASMLDLMRLAASSLDLDEVNQNILGHLMRLIPSDSGSIQLLKGDRLRISAAAGFPPATIKRGNLLLLEDFPLNREVIASKQPARISETMEDDRYRWIPGISNIHSTLAIPIIFRENIIGMATLDSAAPGRFTQEDEDLAMAVANNAANAIGNARLFELEQQGREEAENLRIAASAVTSSLDPQQVLETILTALRQVVPFDSGSILLLEGDKVRVTAAQGLPNLAQVMDRTFPANNKLLDAIAQNNNQPVILYDAQVDPRFEHWGSVENVRGWMGVSLQTRGEVVGYITLDSFEVGTFNENSAALAQTFAYQAAAAIDNAHLYQETRQRLEELEVVGRVTFAFRALNKPDEMLHVLLKEVLKIIGTDTASIWLHEPISNSLDQKVASGWQEQLQTRHLRPSLSIPGRVFRTGEVQLVDDFATDPYMGGNLPAESGWSGIGVPIRTSTQTIGAMLVAVPLPRHIDTAQVQLLTTLAEIAGNAIHRAELYSQSEEQVRRLTALRDVDTAIASSFDLRVTLNILLDHTIAQLHADAGAIFSYNHEMRSLDHIFSLGFRHSTSIQSSLRIGGRILNEALLERKLIHVEDISREANFHRKEIASQEKFITYYAIPLISKGQIKGILEIFYRQPHPPEADWMDFFQTMAGQAAIAIDNTQLFDNLQRSNQELSLAYDTTLEGWGKALELRDRETQGHTLRVTDLTLRLARRVNVPESEMVSIRRGVLLHDIGKMAVPDHILKKSGPLDDKEWVEMRKHPQYAYDLLYPITYLRPALDIPYSHHERWDGEGYPNKIKGADIPLSARIFALVDVWDALLYDRPYRKAWPRQQVIDYIRDESGTRFDPALTEEFLKMIEEEHLGAEP